MKTLYRLFFSVMFLLPVLISEGATFQGTRDDFRDETIYFAMTTRFYDGDPMNNVLSWDKQDVQIANNDPDWRGDFAGLIEKLDYIKALGFTAIWITPVTQNASGEDYHGYHSMDFSNVDLRYESRTEWGSEKDVKFQDLIEAAHKKGLKIILDIVLNHTSNFGESYLNPLFTRNQNIRNQATPAGALIPNTERLSSNYFEQDGNAQYQERFKYFKNPQYDNHNYYHHYGTGWNWDLPNRWWGQIAGDCVDLNTENDVVAEYLVECYGKFIEMGVDGFRIDTTGHISRLTFNTQFIPKFQELFEKYKNKRTDGSAYLMFGECCARFGEVIYRNQHNLSSHFYTWKSDQNLINQYKTHSSGIWWDSQNLPEGHDTPVGPMVDCESETSFNKNSSNVFMKNNAWHIPDYSEYSGFSVIDFPMHYNFNNAGSAINIAKQGDHYYNDASYNVVYVDSHDYCPGPNDGTRFNGGTAQWAENLALMFTFRGIPCIYYGSEVEFMKGKPIDVGGENNKTPRKESGRAYFGHYLEGEVTASDFGEYTATGNVEKTLNGDLAHHIRMLNKIRAAVPALRKGQYTFEGCSGNIAFKRAYNKNGEDSYALVAINGGATFNNVPSGNYVDLVTGESFTPSGGTIKVTAPSNQGQLRVLVKDWKDGKIAEDGKFMYASSSSPKGGNPSFTDPGTRQYYTANDVVGNASVTFSPNGGSFKTETLTVTATLNDVAVSGWYKVGEGEKVMLSKGVSSQFTIGENMAYGESLNVKWEATDGTENYAGTLSYKKVDPNAVINIYVKSSSAPYLYAWIPNTETALNGSWPGNKMTETVEQGGEIFYHADFDVETVNIILSDGNGKTADIKGIESDTYFQYNGGSSYSVIEAPVAEPRVSLSPNGGSFRSETLTVKATLSNATSGWYKIGEGKEISLSSEKSVEFTLGADMSYGENITVSWSATDGIKTNTGKAIYTKSEPTKGVTVYVKASEAPYLYVWDAKENKLNGDWPGSKMSETTKVGENIYFYQAFDAESINVIFNNGKGAQTKNIEGLTQDTYFTYNGASDYTVVKNPGEADKDDATDPSGTYTVYFDNSNTKWNVPYIHYWGGSNQSEWPGVAMSIEVGNIWKYEVAKGTTGILFHPDNNSDYKTSDFKAIANHIYDFNGDRGEYKGKPDENENPGGDGSGSVPAIVPDGQFAIFVKADKSPNIYVWNNDGELNGGWPGNRMSLTCEDNEGQVYYYWIVPPGSDSVNCIFNYNGNEDQTKDLKDIKENTYFEYTGTKDEAPSAQVVPSGIVILSGSEGEQPENPDDGKEDPSDPEDPENPGSGDVDPSDPEDPENPGSGDVDPSDPEDPENPGSGDVDPSDPEDPENPGSGDVDPSDPEDPENPGSGDVDPSDPEDPENPGNGDVDPSDPENPDASIGSLEASSFVNVWAEHGKIYVEVPADMNISIIRIDGKMHIERMCEGLNVIEGLPHGFYVVNGVKVVI